jgi:MFS family permease
VNVLSKSRIIAPPDYNRWLVPPAALAVHLSIGMAYGFSVFWLPLSRAQGITEPLSSDWKVSELAWMYTLFFVCLGSSAALFGSWVEREGPRKAGFYAACCWGGGFLVSALGIASHQLPLLWLGSGVIGGCGLGLGYISPVSMLIRWFPDRRGLATGLAIMGFGGGAMIGSPLAEALLRFWATDTSVGALETFLTLGPLYFAAMCVGAFAYRLPPPGWAPPGAALEDGHHQPARGVPVSAAVRTPQFWLLWAVLCLNVTAGIGVIGMASPMIQEVFSGRVGPKEAAGFTGLLSLFNIGGRIGWATLSDLIGRRATYALFFALGAAVYALVPFAAHAGDIRWFVALLCVALTLYGGGFATIPAYLADVFGPLQVSAIHGRLLTAWSVAGVLGPVMVSRVREAQLGLGTAPGEVYDRILWLFAGLLVVGLVCNLLIKPTSVPWVSASDGEAHGPATPLLGVEPSPGSWVRVGVAWTAVLIPLGWGVLRTLELALQLVR